MGKKSRKESYFWTSYSDLMTSLFFVMLVLFVITVALLHSRIKATEEELSKIKEIEKSIEQIDTKYFVYDTTFKRHTIKNVNVSFQTNSANIKDIQPSELLKLAQAGYAIQEFMKKAKDSIPEAQYLLIIEGQSSKDGFTFNDELSYNRARSLVRYWENDCWLDFNNMDNCELMISGTGENSKFRVQPDIPPNNQRFVIHIIPKPGVVK